MLRTIDPATGGASCARNAKCIMGEVLCRRRANTKKHKHTAIVGLRARLGCVLLDI